MIYILYLIAAIDATAVIWFLAGRRPKRTIQQKYLATREKRSRW